MLTFAKKAHAAYERYLAPVAFLIGFILDNLTLSRIDLWLDNVIILGYLFIAGIGIILINAYDSGKLPGWVSEDVAHFLPLFIQFPLGGLFSVFVVFFSQSGSMSGSWPFLLILAGLLVGNEFFRKRYRRFAFHAGVYYMAIFSYSILIVPVLFRMMGPKIFLVSGLASLFIMAVFLLVTFRITPLKDADVRKKLALTIGAIYIFFNLFYFLNIIPPIPLSMKEGGIYHSVARTPGAEYRISREPPPWALQFFQTYDPVFHKKPGEAVFAFSSVFAPTRFDTAIVHVWSRYDEVVGAWKEADRFEFAITGGRDGGYRGYSQKSSVQPGRWRVDVETERGERLGRLNFTVVDVATSPVFEVILR